MRPRFNMKAQEALERAQQIISDYNHGELKAVHLLLSLLLQNDSLVEVVLDKMNINIDNIIKEVENKLNAIPRIVVQDQNFGQVLLSQEVINVFEKSERLSREEKENYISSEHLFLGLIEVPSEAKNILQDFNVYPDQFKTTLIEARKNMPVDDEKGSVSYKILEKYSQNLTEKARLDKLDPLIGREVELERIMQILSRRMKNNPVLLGEPGVGKTAIVEGLAQRIIKKEVPDNLKNKEILSLDIGAMIAGTKFRGEFEERLKNVLKEIKQNEDKYIIFIDELQTIVGAGASEGSIDASNLLKPALSRGEIRLIGATTFRDYRDSIERDPALERRFQPVTVEEPSIDDAITILRGLKNKYEVYHGVRISDDAIKAAVNLSSRYIPERFLPDKAIDLIDEAGSSLKLQMNSTPTEIASIQKKIRVLEIEYEAIKKEEGISFENRVKEITKLLKTLKHDEKNLLEKWNVEKSSVTDIHELKKQINSLEKEAENFENEGNLEKVAEIMYGKIPLIEKEIKKLEKLSKQKVQSQFVKEEIDAYDISKIISKWTGVPADKMLANEKEKVKNVREILKSRVIGQDEAIESVSRSIIRSRAGIADEDKPIGSFMFLGPTGVGKTELAKTLAEFMFNDEKAIIRIDMSEYMEHHSVARLIGSPPGYIGYDEGGQLTETIKHKPYSLVLFDEIEKAHPEVFNLLLQVLDNGRLTDGKGRTVNFKNTIIIMTSNIGGEYISQMQNIGFNNNDRSKKTDQEYEEKKIFLKEKIQSNLKSYFKPEFLNRVDEIVVFNPLRLKDMHKIVDIQMSRVVKRLENKGIKLIVDNSTKNWLADNGYDAEYGARPLKRLIQKEILDPMADNILNNDINEGSIITVTVKNNKIDFKIKKR